MNESAPFPSHTDFSRWLTQCWRTERRYYQAELMQDLFGTWLVKRSWGGLGSRARQSKTMPAADYDHALTLLEDVGKRRQQRGYVRFSSSR